MSEFPTDWTRTTFGNVLKQRKEAGFTSEELLAVTSSAGIVKRDSLERRDTSNEDKSKYLLVEEGDIAYNTMRMWQGVSGVSRFRGIVSPAYTICTPTEGLDKDFAGYLLKDPEMISIFRKRSQGLVSDTWNLKYESFAQIPCTIPPLPEQKKIAEILSWIDHGIQATQLALSRHEIASNASVFNQISTLASDEENLRSVEEVSSRITDGEHQTPPRTSRGVFLLSARNIRDGFISASDVDYISEETHQHLSRRISPCQDDLLISCSGSVGRCCLVPAGIKFSMVRSVALVRPERSLICPAYLLAAFSSEFVQRQIRSSLSQLAQANLFQGAIKKIIIPVPPQEEQERIGKLFSSGKEYCKRLRQKTEKLELLKQALAIDLLSGRKRVSV